MIENQEKYEVEASPLESDKLVEISQQAEKRIEAVKKIKTMSLRLTNSHDWVDQGGKPYLQVSGSEKVARLFGISWRFLGEIQRKDEEGGHFSFEVPMEFVMSGASVEFRGSRSSKDPFFSKKYGADIPPSEIDRTDVMKAAITNTIGNGITRLLGIRNLTWGYLAEAGIKQGDVGKVDYKKKENGKTTEIKDPDSPATEGQIKAIHAILGGLGIKDDHDKCEKVTIIIMGEGKTPIPHISSESITKGQASRVIDTLNKEKK